MYEAQGQLLRNRTHDLIECLQDPEMRVSGYRVETGENWATMEEGQRPRMSSVTLLRSDDQIELSTVFARWRRGAEEEYRYDLMLGATRDRASKTYIRYSEPVHSHKLIDRETGPPEQADIQWAKGLLWTIDHAVKERRLRAVRATLGDYTRGLQTRHLRGTRTAK